MNKSLLVAAAAVPFALLAACGGASTEAEATETIVAEVQKIDTGSGFSAVPSGAYALDKGHGYIMMTYNHQGYSSPYVRFVGFDANLTLDVDNPTNSGVTVAIDPATIDSGVERFDNHLRSDEIFDVANHPEITFVSTALAATGDNTGTLTGDLTIKGNTKSVTLDVTFNKADLGREGKGKVGFSARGSVLRSDFGVDIYTPYVGDEVDLIIETEFVQQ